MNTQPDQALVMRLTPRIKYLSVVTSFIETTATAFGLADCEALELKLATEEIFAYLCKEIFPEESIEIQCLNKIYFMRTQFLFSVPVLNLGGLNITSTIGGDQETGLENMGLILASRSVDRLNIIADKRNRICLAIDKEKEYHPATGALFRPPEVAQGLTLKTADTEALKQLAVGALQMYPESLLPAFFNYPGKVVDMVASGEYQAIVAVTPKEAIAGGVLFHFQTERIVQVIGPYVLQSGKEDVIAGKLLDACIASVARTKAIGLLSLTGLPESLHSNFETLGSLLDYRADGKTVRQPSFYRLLHEDPGASIWTHADLNSYLDREYRRLVLARDIKVVQDLGETRSGVSIFSAEVHRDKSEVVLRPLWPGADFAANVKQHISLLRKDRISNLFFELDLGIPWHAALIPALLANQFNPEMILPFAGQADLVVFQYHAP